jgi:ligA protein|nr:MAG TPA: SGNH hydrolase [Bacteriophage sp.]
MTIYELQQRAKMLRTKTQTGSITPDEVGSLHEDTLAYIATLEQSLGSLGIKKVYPSKSAMEADTTPVGNNGKAIRHGQLACVYDHANPESTDNGDIYAYQAQGWLKIGNIATETNISVVQDLGDSPVKVMSQKAVTDAIEKAGKNNDNVKVRKIADVVNGEKKERNVEIDFSKLELINAELIFQNTGKWMRFTTGFKYYLIPNDGYKEVTITPLHSRTYYTFLKSDSHVSDTVPDYCDGYSNVKEASSAETLRIPEDCRFIYLLIHYDTENTEASVSAVQEYSDGGMAARLKAVQEKVENMNLSSLKASAFKKGECEIDVAYLQKVDGIIIRYGDEYNVWYNFRIAYYGYRLIDRNLIPTEKITIAPLKKGEKVVYSMFTDNIVNVGEKPHYSTGYDAPVIIAGRTVVAIPSDCRYIYIESSDTGKTPVITYEREVYRGGLDANLVFLGDSIFNMAGPNFEGPSGWGYYFRKLTNPKSIRNYGTSGATISQTSPICMSKQVQQLMEDVDANRIPLPDTIVIGFGINDILWDAYYGNRHFAMTAEEAFADMSAMIADLPATEDSLTRTAKALRWNLEKLITKLPYAQIIMLSPMQSASVDDEKFSKIQNIIEYTAYKFALPLIRQDKELQVSSYREKIAKVMTSDGVHPSAKGAKYIGEYYATRLSALIKENYYTPQV